MISAIETMIRRFYHPRLREGATGGLRREVHRIVVFGRFPNPTFDYYLLARLEADGMPPFHLVDIAGGDLAPVEARGAFVIVCRYAGSGVLDWLDANEKVLAGVALLLDDDIPALVSSSEAFLTYRLFLFYRALRPLRRLNRHLDFVWASTPTLALTLAAGGATVFPPAPALRSWSDAAPVREKSDRIRIVYHATAVHQNEHAFLLPIMTEVMRLRDNVEFEVTAKGKAVRLWSSLTRTKVVAPLPWHAYLERSARLGADIVLVPLISTKANDSRSDTKRIDVARMGAAAIFSASKAYGHPDGDPEIRVENNARDWTDAIIALIDDTQERRLCAASTAQKVEAMTKRAVDGIPQVRAAMPGQANMP